MDKTKLSDFESLIFIVFWYFNMRVRLCSEYG